MGIFNAAFKEMPFFLVCLFGILIPEVYLHRSWGFRKLAWIRILTLIIVVSIAGFLEYVFHPDGDFMVFFTRAFVFIGFCRIILMTTHMAAQKQNENKKEI